MIDPEIIARVAERKITEAMEEGKFDDLPGKGKPIIFEDDPMTPPHLRMANKVLRNAGVLPDWMQVQKDLYRERQEIGGHRARLGRENAKKQATLANLPPYHAAVKQFEAWYAKSRADYLRRVKDVNTLILKLSMMAPSTVQPPRPYKVETEMERFDAEFPPLPQQNSNAATLPETKKENPLRGLAREQYRSGEGGGEIGGWVKAARLLRGSSRSNEIQTGGQEAEDVRNADAPRPE